MNSLNKQLLDRCIITLHLSHYCIPVTVGLLNDTVHDDNTIVHRGVALLRFRSVVYLLSFPFSDFDKMPPRVTNDMFSVISSKELDRLKSTATEVRDDDDDDNA